MNFKLVAYNLGIITLLLACSMFLGMVWAAPCFGGVWENESRGVAALLGAIFITGTISFLLFRYGKHARRESVFRREAIAIVGLGWILSAICCALPYWLSGIPRAVLEDGTLVPMSVVDCLYESISGITTTGGTVISDVENPATMPRTILFWRSLTHFIGGLGIVVLLVALLNTGMAGRLLVQGELSGPKQGGLGGRIQMTMRRTLTVYLFMNAVLVILLTTCGLSCYDSLCFSFGTIATGGLAPKNTSFAFYRTVADVNFVAAEWILGTFAFISGMNLVSLYLLGTGNWRPLVKCREWQVYLTIVLATAAGISILQYTPNAQNGIALGETVRNSYFQVVSCITTTGYATCNYTLWTTSAQMLLFALMFISACSGSTSGGVKIARYILLFKILNIELEKIYRPAIVRPLYYNGERLRETSVISGVLMFFAMAFLTILGTWFFLVMVEPNTIWEGRNSVMTTKTQDLFCTSVSHFANVGMGMGVFGFDYTFGELSEASKFMLACVMLLGRLDFFAILLLFSPTFWKK